MHNHAHGVVAHRIIEVDGAIVESFLGRIEDPDKSQKTALNIINDPAFRTILIARIKRFFFKDIPGENESKIIENQYESILEFVNKFKGRVVKQRTDSFLISFDSVTNAVLCALEIQTDFYRAQDTQSYLPLKLQIGLSAGIPVSEKEGIFEDTIKMAEYLCDVVKGNLVVSMEVKDLYESENLNIQLDKSHIKVLHSSDEEFINNLMDYTEREWSNPNLNIEDFSRNVGYSKSQFYRKMISITGKSPNRFIREYRLEQAIKLLRKKNDNISEVAYETGFSTPAYFSKCFLDAFGILPSHFLKSFHS